MELVGQAFSLSGLLPGLILPMLFTQGRFLMRARSLFPSSEQPKSEMGQLAKLAFLHFPVSPCFVNNGTPSAKLLTLSRQRRRGK